MAATTNTKMSIYEKLIQARINFGMADKKMSGKNDHAQFLYYELNDIVPLATKILYDLGLVYIVTFEDTYVIGRLVDISSKEEIDFKLPFREIKDPAKFRMNETMSCGAEITYYRRYCYFVLLDIVEPDAFNCLDNGAGIDEKPKKEKKAPATTEQREEIKTQLIEEATADEDHINALKAALKKVKSLGDEEFAQKIVMKTDTFKNLTQTTAEQLIQACGNRVEELKKGTK